MQPRSPIPAIQEGAAKSCPSFFPPSHTAGKIKARNTRIDIVNPSSEEKNILAKSLSVYDDYANFPRVLWRGMVTRVDEKGNIIVSIPRFVPYGVIKSIFQEIPIYETDSVTPERPAIVLNAAPRSELQERAVKFLFPNGRFFDEPVKALDLPVGEGKTFLAILAIARMGLKANIFVKKLTMIENPWIKDILAFTDIKREEIGIIQGSDSLEKIMANAHKYKIFITVEKTFVSIASKNMAFETIERMYQTLGIGINVVDEAHLELLATFLVAMYTRPKFTLYLTATLGRTDFSESKMINKVIPVHKSFANTNNIDTRKFVTYRKRHYKTTPSDAWVKKFSQDRGVKSATYYSYIESVGESYYAMLHGIYDAVKEIIAESNNEAKNLHIAVVIGSLAIIRKMFINFQEDFPELSVGNFTGDVAAKVRNIELTRNIIFATEKGLDSATDTTLDGMILTVPNTSDILLTQITGRLRYRQEKPIQIYPVYDIMDIGFKKTANNALSRSNVITRSIALNVG